MNIISPERFKNLVQKLETLKPILVVGDVGLDKYTYGSVQRISPEAPVPILEVEKEWEKLGLAANISHNLKTLGVESVLCGVLGNDEKSRRFESLLEDIGLKIWGLVKGSQRVTVFKQRMTTAAQQICRVDYEENGFIEGETLKLFKERIDDLGRNAVAVIVEDYSKGTLPQELLQYLIDKNNEEGKLVAIDPGKKTPPLWYKGADLLKPNFSEAKQMVEQLGYSCRKEELGEMASILVDKLKLKKLVITLGGNGMAYLESEGAGNLSVIPTLAGEVFDVSGAGDTAISLLTTSLMAGADLGEAAWIGNCGAGVVVAKKGTATVSVKELFDFYNRAFERYQNQEL